MDMQKRILVGEPSPMVGKILQDKLQREGHAVTWIGDPTEIQTSLDRGAPDLLILNAMLPEGDGIRIFQGIPRVGAELPYPVILTFDKALYAEEEPGLQALNPTAIVPLPFKPTVVARQVRRLRGG